jgi:hypothetical protein
MTTTASRRRVHSVAAKPALHVVQPMSDRERRLVELEGLICDLDRSSRIAYLMTMHDLEEAGGHTESLGLHAIEHVERQAKELREAFNLAFDGEPVRS